MDDDASKPNCLSDSIVDDMLSQPLKSEPLVEPDMDTYSDADGSSGHTTIATGGITSNEAAAGNAQQSSVCMAIAEAICSGANGRESESRGLPGGSGSFLFELMF
ncbi:unnamed protein product [Protopolystoma xenopodis]|uniref:Uncharacterized protein n=1 Tax=Protopolystoma xenopodis TaxID=117903 RepID=A0A3S5BAU1_9PLAT|nr:unnamed protein product [Protopolystoma xenopodis]